ncbi:hypothetical protein SLEP1_g1543 [Rubroshorea leprosula]|uniref:Uncharacterized protein n=1 Tax=Rubroshorea leprosula TaxID=152421 RepID=A0AAV5HMV7_9ROSI|nr:hypothetical protein SLEP1_g1543 [Rubroshorea leprosula]
MAVACRRQRRGTTSRGVEGLRDWGTGGVWAWAEEGAGAQGLGRVGVQKGGCSHA